MGGKSNRYRANKRGLVLKAIFVPKVWMLLIPTLIFYSAFYIYPLTKLISLGFFDPDFTLRHFAHFFENPAYLKVLINTIGISITVALLCLLIGYPTAYFLAHLNSRLANILMIAVILPYFTSIMVRTFSWIILLGREGVFNQFLTGVGIIDEPLKMIFNSFGVHVGMVHFLLPYAIMIIHSVMKNIDSNLTRSSESLGASRIQTFVLVYLPLSMPGVIGSAILIFIIALGFFVTPALLGGLEQTMLAQFIEIQVHETVNWGFASAISIVLLATTMLIFLFFNKFLSLHKIWGGEITHETDRATSDPERGEVSGFRQSPIKCLSQLIDKGIHVVLPISVAHKIKETISSTVIGMMRREPTLGKFDIGKIFIALTGITVLIYLLFPVLINFPISFSTSRYFDFPPTGFTLRWYENYFNSSEWTDATLFSLKVAAIAAVFSVIMGTLTSFGIVRSKLRGKQMLYLFFLSPVIVPVIIIAVSSYFLMVELDLMGTAVGIALIHSVIIIPITVIIIISNIVGFDQRLEQAALSLGASRLRTFFTVTFPIIRTGIFIAALFAFIYSFDEVVISLFLSEIKGTTLPVVIWETIREELNPTISAVCSILVAITAVLLILVGLAKKPKEQ